MSAEPAILRVKPEGIDDSMKRLRWVNWAIEGDEGKVPRRPDDPRRKAKSNDATTWGSFEQALRSTEEYLVGVGIPLAQASPYLAIDIDVPAGDTDEWVPAMGRLGDAVVECSPSGEKNRRIYLRDVTVPEWWVNLGGDGPDTREVKLFDDSGYVTVTGDVIEGHGPPIGETSQVAFEMWLKEAWRAFNPDADESAEPWRETPPGKKKENPRATGSELVDLRVSDVLSGYSAGDRGSHPYHGSSTGTNFIIDDSGGKGEAGVTWRCWRHETTGNPIHLIGMEAGIIECGEWDSGLSRATWREIFDYARANGYLPEDSEPSPTANETAHTERESDGATWRAVRDGLSDPSVPNGPAYQHGAELLLDSHPVLTERETGRTLAYDDETGIYHGHGKPILQRELVERLETEYLTGRQREILARVTGQTETPMDEIGGPEGNICVANGVLDLADPNDPELTAHDPEHGFRRALAVEYDPDADCPQFREFLGEVVDPDDLDTLQEYAGYCLAHWGQPFKRACVLVGPRDAGKTTFTGILTAILSADNVSAEPLDKLVNSRWGVARTYRKLLNAPDEMGSAALDDIPRFNSLLGGGRKVTAERKGEKKFDFEPTAKHIYAANDLPEIGGSIGPNTREAFFSRLLFVRFPESIPESEQVRELGQELVETEGQGILNWMLEGYRRLLDQDGFTRDPDPERKARTWARHGDSISQFKLRRLCFTFDPEDWIAKNEAYEQYVQFCKDEGVLAKDDREFKRRMGNDDRVAVKRGTDPKTGMRPRVFVGVRRA